MGMKELERREVEKWSRNEEIITREFGDVEIRAVKGEERKFELSFSSEEPYRRWYTPEILDHSDGCVDLDRINKIGCVLFNHNRDAVIGKVIKAWVENRRGKAIISFDEDEESERIYKKVKTETLKAVSVGYRVSVWEEVEPGEKSTDGRFDGPCDIAKRWDVMEISIVSVPADATVGVNRGAETEKKEKRSQKNGSMLEIYSRQLQINKFLIGGTK